MNKVIDNRSAFIHASGEEDSSHVIASEAKQSHTEKEITTPFGLAMTMQKNLVRLDRSSERTGDKSFKKAGET